jgi:hypothetical protein
MDGGIGLDQVPAGFAASNFYYNVGTIIRKAGGVLLLKE